MLLTLRAFSLQRTGKSDEALATLQAIVDKGPESERVLHTMTFTYRAAGKPEAIVPAYAAAAEKSPQDLEILKGLFGAYAKDLNFVKQQQIALKLAKAQPEEADRYSWWAIVSLTLQARELATPPGSNAEQLMKLAETMIVRQITKSKGTLPSYEALLLYIDILQGQGRAAEAATIIKKAAGTPAGGLQDDSRQLLAAALVRSGDLSAAAELFKLACLENTDDWWSWQLYLNCILPSSVKHASSELNTPGMVFSVGIVGGLAEIWDAKHLDTVWQTDATAGGEGAGQPPPPPPLEERLKTATATLEELKTVSKPGQSRGAVLAPLELACRLHRLGLSTDRHLSEAIVAALPSLCHSFSCAVDLRRYTSHLQISEDRKWLAEEITKICEEKAKAFEQEKNNSDEGDENKNKSINKSTNKAAIKALWCRTNAYAFQQELGCSRPPSSAAAVEYAVQLIDLFSSNLALSESLDPKDRGHGEDLVALAAGSLVSAINTRDGNANLLLLTAILALEAAQVRRTVAAPLRLSACALYALLNAPAKATAQLTALDVKSILHESMTGHWALPTLLASASPEADFEKWLSGISNLHVDQVLEASESIFTAYEQGTYSKIPEFVDFWETLGNSHTRWSATAEKNILKLKSQQAAATTTTTLAATAKEIVENAAGHRTQVDKIRFNEDLSTRPAWFPPAAVDTRLALVSWWEGRANDDGEDSVFSLPAMPAASEMWWGVTGAAERKVPQAEQWRQAQRHGLARRQAIPQLLAGLLQPKLLKREDVTTLVQILGDSWNERATYPTSSNSSGTITSSLAISKALFYAGINLHQAIDAASGDAFIAAEMICEQVCATLDEFQQQFSGFLLDIAKLLRLNKDSVLLPLLGNSWPALLATLLSEEVQWAAACFPTWAKLIKSSFPSTADNGAQNQLKENLQNAVHRAGNAIYVALVALKEQLAATSSSSSAPATTAAEILAKIESTWPQASTLWKYESTFDPKKAVQDVVAEQQAVVNRMNQLTTRAVTRLKQFSF